MNEKLLEDLRNDLVERKKENENRKVELDGLEKAKDLKMDNFFVKAKADAEAMKNRIFDEEQIFHDSLKYYDALGLCENSNNIYFYLGSFVIGNSNNYQVIRDNIYKEPDYNLYIDIETKRIIGIDFYESEKFEKENKVIVCEDYPSMASFEIVRNNFLSDAVKNGQEKACKRVLSRYNKK